MQITLNHYFNMIMEAEYLFFCLFFSYHFPRKRHFYVKASLLGLLFLGICFLSQSINIGNFIVSNSLNYSIMFITGIIYLFLCFDYPLQSALYLSTISYVFRHIIYLLWQLLTYILESAGQDMSNFNYLWVLMATISFVAYLPVGIWLFLRIKEFPDVALPKMKILVVSLVALFVAIVLNSFSIYYDFDGFSPSLPYVLNIFSVLCSAMIIFLLMSNAKEVSLKTEIDSINQLRYQEEKQYRMSKESIDLINIKCHDLRHQIRNLKNSHKQISEDELSQIEDAIRIYDTKVKTGNDSLDIILQEKSLKCNNDNITFDYIIDGKLLSFMKENDVYSLFGNIIDNSIEACLKISDTEKRIIRLKIKSAADGVFAIEENPYVGEMKMVDGLPVTDKKDSDYHGFGLKSILHIVKAYHGTMKITNDNQNYRISIFFPMNS